MRPSPTADERPLLARNRTSQGFYRCSFMRSRPSALETLNEPLVSLGVRFTSRLWAFLSWLAALLMPFPPERDAVHSHPSLVSRKPSNINDICPMDRTNHSCRFGTERHQKHRSGTKITGKSQETFLERSGQRPYPGHAPSTAPRA